MKVIKRLTLLAVVAATIGFSMPAAFAADAPAPAAAAGLTFGVVDMNKVMQTADAAKDVLSQLEAKRKEYQVQSSKEEEGLRSSEQEIVKQRDTLSKEEFDKKRQSFEAKVENEQKLVHS